MRLILRIISLSLLLVSCSEKEFWQEGDILFQDGDCGDFCDAIKKVTQGYQGIDFSHNGLLMKDGDSWYVLEAVGKGVSMTDLKDFLTRHLDEDGNPKVMVGRLKAEHRYLIPDAIKEAQRHLGKPYDHVFNFDNDAFYCSELIHFAFKAANSDQDFFTPEPMTYKDPDTGELFPIWDAYFKKLGEQVPEGEFGLNPGSMSLAPILEMISLHE